MQEVDPSAKAIVFSQFVNMLDLIEYRIQVGGYRCVKLVGSMSVDHRDKAITSFKEDPDVKVGESTLPVTCCSSVACCDIVICFVFVCARQVLLISLKAGGVALNLTVANHIFIMDVRVFLLLRAASFGRGAFLIACCVLVVRAAVVESSG
jgi:DNA repair protein RAD16